jgi:hypothetical protein
MTYGSTTLATDFRPRDWPAKLITTVFFFIPRSNPNNERYFPEIKKWVLELDDTGMVIREVGLNKDGIPLFRSPAGKDLGFWTDEDKKFKKEEIEYISPQEFENLWGRAQK